LPNYFFLLYCVLMSDMRVIQKTDSVFPKRLHEIHASPEVLYVRGTLKTEEQCLAIVGTRKPTRYGVEATERLVRELSEIAGLTIVSGLASGIDTVAHKAALKSGLRTIAVLGSGIDAPSIFPRENKNLADEIITKGGAILSEYPAGTPPLWHHFPERNRIVSGLSLGVVVIEAKERSGALITARFALEHDREVFALPGSIFSKESAGPNGLIKRGAKAITSAEDILEELSLQHLPAARKIEQKKALEGEEKTIFEILEASPSTVAELKLKAGLSTPQILSTLAMLELKKLVKRMENEQWTKIS